jgi:hypothetical protein
MLHRLTILTFLASYAAAQLAALPHGHGAGDEGHPQRPHLHGDWFMSWFESGGPPGHHSHPHAPWSSHESHDDPAVPADRGDHGHDDDCVYAPHATAAAKEIRWIDPQCQLVGYLADGFVTCHQAAPDSLGSSIWQPVPGAAGEHCALYLTLRTLRI